MQIRKESFALFVTIASVAFLGTLGFFVYVLFIATWAGAWKLVSILLYILVVLSGVVVYQSVAAKRYALQMTASGFGDEHVFADLYQNSPVPYVRTDKNGIILHTNAAAVRLFEHPVEELTGRSLFDLLQETESEDEERAITLPYQMRQGQFVNEVEVEIPTDGQESKWALLSAFPYNHNQERLVAIVDMTEQKKVDQAKTEFVSLASHQLRTPISATLWNLELLTAQSPELNETQTAYLQKIGNNVRKMNELVDDFLDATKLEMGTFATKPGPLQVNAFVQGICDEFEAMVVNKSLNLSVELLPSDVVTETDEHLLHMIVSNLVSNAVKYTLEGGTVVVHVDLDGQALYFRVRDSGIGVPAADQSLLFSKLYRASNTKTSETQGTGLGLYVVKQAVEILGGQIDFASEEGVGTEFLVLIPYHPVQI